MHRGRIGQGHFIQFPDVVADDASVKVNLDLAVLDIDLGHTANVPLEDVLFVIIDRLNDFISRGIGPPKPCHTRRRLRIEGLLEHRVEGTRTQAPTVHGCQDLHIANQRVLQRCGSAPLISQ
jgi:hypothetical protein